MKKKIVMALAGLAMLGLIAGCGSSSDIADTSDTAAAENTLETENTDTAESTAEEDTTDAAASETETTDTADETASEEAEASADSEGGKTLVVYYSATGNTENVANYIADATGGDLFELEPVEPYTDEDLNYNDENSRVSQECADESLRNVELVSTTVDGFEDYSVVYIGYPKIQYGFLSV